MPDDTQVVTQAERVKPLDRFKTNLELMGANLGAVLPPHISVEKFKKTVLSAVQNNPDLLKAEQRSLWNACMRAASDGVLPDNRESTIQVYKNKDKQTGEFVLSATYMPMYQGIMKRARNSGDVKWFDAFPVYENDKFRHWVDTEGEHLLFEPCSFGDERGPLIGAFAAAKDTGGNLYVEAMPAKDIEKVRAASKSKDGPAWTHWKEEMYRKTPIRRLSKRLPLSAEVQGMIERDETLQLAAPVIDHHAEPAAPEAEKPKRGRKKLDEFAGQGDAPAQGQNDGGDHAPAADDASASPSVGEELPPQDATPGTAAAAPPYAPPKLGWGGKPATFHAALVAELAKCATQENVAVLEKVNEGNIGFLAKQAADLHAAWTQARDERLEELRP